MSGLGLGWVGISLNRLTTRSPYGDKNMLQIQYGNPRQCGNGIDSIWWTTMELNGVYFCKGNTRCRIIFPFPATGVNKKTFGFAKEPRGQLNLYSRMGGLKIKLAK